MPTCEDRAWCTEMDSVAEFCVGRGLDPGAGNRTFDDQVVCVDVTPQTPRVMQGDATALSFEADSFDYVITSHLIEHLARPRNALREWLRVVRVGGHVCTIIPNTEYTLGRNSDPTPHLHEWSPREFVLSVLGLALGQEPWFTAMGSLSWAPADVVLVDEAQPHWSFCVVLRKSE